MELIQLVRVPPGVEQRKKQKFVTGHPSVRGTVVELDGDTIRVRSRRPSGPEPHRTNVPHATTPPKDPEGTSRSGAGGSERSPNAVLACSTCQAPTRRKTRVSHLACGPPHFSALLTLLGPFDTTRVGIEPTWVGGWGNPANLKVLRTGGDRSSCPSSRLFWFGFIGGGLRTNSDRHERKRRTPPDLNSFRLWSIRSHGSGEKPNSSLYFRPVLSCVQSRFPSSHPSRCDSTARGTPWAQLT